MGTLLPFALGIAINPASIVAAILLLTSSRGLTKGLAYVTGWLLGLMTLVIAMVLLVSTPGFKRMSTTGEFTAWVMLVIGLTLLIMAFVQWRQRPPADAKIPFDWLRAVPRATSFMALAAGLFFGLFNMKNLLLMTAAAVVISEGSLGLDDSIRLVLLFVAIATAGIAAPLIVSFTDNEHSGPILADWENGLSVHNVTITCIVMVIIAVQMLGLGLGGLLEG